MATRNKAAPEKQVLAANEKLRLATQIESGAVNLSAPATVDLSTDPEGSRFTFGPTKFNASSLSAGSGAGGGFHVNRNNPDVGCSAR